MQRNKRLESLEQKYLPPPQPKPKWYRPDDPRYGRVMNPRMLFVSLEELKLLGAMTKVCEGLDASAIQLIERATNLVLNFRPTRKLK